VVVYWISEIVTSVAAYMCNWLVGYFLTDSPHAAQSFLRS